MATIFFWTGAVVWCCIAVLAGMLLYEIATGFVRACSWVRWVLAVKRVHGRDLKWRHFIGSFVRQWWGFCGRNRGDIRMRCEGGYWQGVGDWRVYQQDSSNAEVSR